MRVLFCSQAAHTGGGVEAWMETLTAALSSRGAEVFTALASGTFHDPDRYTLRHRVANPLAVDGLAGFRETRVYNLLRLFEKVRPDVIVPVNLEDALLAASYWKTRGGTARIVTCTHGQGSDRIEQLRSCAPFIDLAVTVARRVAGQIEPIMNDRQRVRHIPMGVPPPRHDVRVRDRLLRLGYVGRLSQAEKRVLDAVDLMRHLEGSGVMLRIAGTGPEEHVLREQLRHMPVEFLGDQPRDVLYDSFYPTLDALVLFSEAEAGPIVAWEAMIHGVVPVVSDWLGRAEEGVIRDGETGAVFPIGDMTAAAQIIRHLSLAGALTALSRRAREIPAPYTLEAFENSWHEALEECLRLPLRTGSRAELPPLISPGRLARMNLSVETMARLRVLLKRRFTHHDSGSEWPH
jgi:glycosyltransferase involved in cell wall biosynthesis